MIECRPEGKIVGPIAASVVSTRLYGNIKLMGVNHAAVLVHLLLVVVNVVLVLALLSFSFGWIRIHGGVVQIFAKRRQRPVVIEKIVVVVELVTVISFALFAVVVFKLAARIVPVAIVVFLFLIFVVLSFFLHGTSAVIQQLVRVRVHHHSLLISRVLVLFILLFILLRDTLSKIRRLLRIRVPKHLFHLLPNLRPFFQPNSFQLLPIVLFQPAPDRYPLDRLPKRHV